MQLWSSHWSSFVLVVVVIVVVVLVVALVLLVKDSEDASDDHGSEVQVELVAEAVEGIVWKLLVEEDLVGVLASEHGDTSDEGVGAEESSQVHDEELVEFVGEVTHGEGTEEAEGGEEGDVLDPLGEDEGVEEETNEETGGGTEEHESDSSDGLDEQTGEDTSSCGNNEWKNAKSDLSTWWLLTLIKSNHKSEDWGEEEYNHEGDTASDGSENVWEEFTTVEGNDTSEDEEQHSESPWVLSEVSDDWGGFEHWATSLVSEGELWWAHISQIKVLSCQLWGSSDRGITGDFVSHWVGSSEVSGALLATV